MYFRRLQIFLIPSEIHPIFTNPTSCLLHKEVSDARARPVALPRVAPGCPRLTFSARLRERLECPAPRSHLPTSRKPSIARSALLHSVLLKLPNALWPLEWGLGYAGRTSSGLRDPLRRYKISSSSTTPRVFPSNRCRRFLLRPRDPRPFLLLRHLRVRDSSPTTTCVLSSFRVARPILPSIAPARRTLPVEDHFPTHLPVPKPTNVGAAGKL